MIGIVLAYIIMSTGLDILFNKVGINITPDKDIIKINNIAELTVNRHFSKVYSIVTGGYVYDVTIIRVNGQSRLASCTGLRTISCSDGVREYQLCAISQPNLINLVFYK